MEGKRSPRALALMLAVAASAVMPLSALAGPSVTLSAEARDTIANDRMLVVMAAQREGPQVAQLNEQVVQALNEALAQARRTAGVKPRLGSIRTQPLYDQKGRTGNFQVSGELMLEGSDFGALGALAGELGQKLQFVNVNFSLSPQRRAQEERRLIKEAAQALRDKAQAVASAFDSSGYELKKVEVGSSSNVAPVPRRIQMADSMSLAKAAPVPVEGGDSEVMVTMGATVELR